MCEYIKDDGEQCGIDTEPFCHMHDDTEQAEQWRDEKREMYGAVSGSSDDFNGYVMDATCGECETPLRRTERLTEHPNFDGRVLFEAVVECDCSEHVLGAQSVLKDEISDGWTQ